MSRTDRRRDERTDGQTDKIVISISRVSVLTCDKNEKIRVTLCENAAGALFVVNKVGLLHAGGGIPCRPHLAATQLVYVSVNGATLVGSH